MPHRRRSDSDAYTKSAKTYFLTARECAESPVYDEVRPEFVVRFMGKPLEEMLDAMVAELGISAGWFFEFPDAFPVGPFATEDGAQLAAKYWVES